MAESSTATLERGWVYACSHVHGSKAALMSSDPDFEWWSRLLFLARLKEAQDAIGACADEQSPLLALPEPVGMREEEMARKRHGKRRLEGFREAVHSARAEESGRWAQRSTHTAADIRHHSLRQTAPIPDQNGIRGDVHPAAFGAALDTHVMHTGMETNGSSSLAMSLNVHIGTCACLSWERLPTTRVRACDST